MAAKQIKSIKILTAFPRTINPQFNYVLLLRGLLFSFDKYRSLGYFVVKSLTPRN